ncbi:MAG: branched-chain amino acid ABC transporter permease [Spirochaetota bacterium]
MLYLQYAINGLAIGAIYALIALGYTIVYGILQFINFAHGGIMMIGTYVGLSVYAALFPLANGDIAIQIAFSLLAILAAMLSSAVLGYFIEQLAYRPLRNSPRLAPLLSAVGMSIVLENVAALIWGTRNRSFPTPYPNKALALWHSGDKTLIISTHDLVVLLSGIVVLTFTYIATQKTRWGKSLRATSMDARAAALMGIPVNRVISSAFILGSLLAAQAGCLAAMSFTAYPTMGSLWGLKAFIAAVLGGIGSLPGAMLGGLVLGLLDSFGQAFLGGYKDVLAFSILLLVLIFKPSGLMGKNIREKI